MKYNNSWVVPKSEILKQKLRFRVTKQSYYKKFNYEYVMHNHILNEIEFVSEGTATHIINGNKYECVKGCIYLMSQLDVHNYQLEDSAVVYSLCFSDDFLPYEIMEKFRVSKCPYYAKLVGEDYEYIKNRFDRIIQENESDNICKEVLIKNYVSEIVIEILRKCVDTSKFKNQPQQKAREVLAYIRENFKEDISLESTAEHFKITSPHLSRLFKNSLDITFNDYLRGLRLDYAMRLINVTSISITDVCTKSGFNSPAHFSKVFKDRFGVSPTFMRRKSKIQNHSIE